MADMNDALRAARVAGAAGVGRCALSLCLLLAAEAFPQGVIETISKSFAGRGGAGPGAVVGIVVFFGVIIGLLIFFYVGSRRSQEKIQEELSAKLFGEGCERTRLTRDEMNALLGIVAFAPDPPTRGHLIFESLPLYERCLDAYVEHTPRLQFSSGRGGGVEEQDELLLRLRKKLGYAILSPEQPVVSTRNLSVGQKMSVFAPGQRSDPFSANVTHVGEFWFTVRLQEDFMGLVSLGGLEKTLAFLRQGDAAYSVTVKVREISQSGEINFYHSTRLSRNQHRQYMRLDIDLAVKFRVIERANSFDDRLPNELLSAHTADISGGGVCLIVKEPLRVGDVIMLSIYIPGCAINDVRAKILKVIAVEGRTATHYRHLVQFISIEPQQREKIVKYIFDKHRASLQKR
ncbi:MAG: PilZ domain-containing protein [Chitinispirillales bacterium]|jgi:c-di-GMP-binding flagellar brake protein YcgR|nr:PilZ domain-containing protein [Chitinispirillales bacterium]